MTFFLVLIIVKNLELWWETFYKNEMNTSESPLEWKITIIFIFKPRYPYPTGPQCDYIKLTMYLGVCIDIAVRVEDWDDNPVEHVHQVAVDWVGHQLPQYEGHRSWTDPLPSVA